MLISVSVMIPSKNKYWFWYWILGHQQMFDFESRPTLITQLCLELYRPNKLCLLEVYMWHLKNGTKYENWTSVRCVEMNPAVDIFIFYPPPTPPPPLHHPIFMPHTAALPAWRDKPFCLSPREEIQIPWLTVDHRPWLAAGGRSQVLEL